jgi:MFS family permease
MAYGTALGGLLALAAAIGIGRFAYTPILPAMVEALGLHNSAAGVIASANYLGYLVGAGLAASPLLPGPRRVWLLSSLAVSTATTAGMGLAGTMVPFLILRFVGGAASAFVLVLSSAMVLEAPALAGRTVLSALHFAGVGCGIAISAILVASLMHTGQSWQSLWLATGAVSLVATLMVALLVQERSSRLDSGSGTAQTIDPRLPRLVIAYGLFGFGYVITATFLVAIVRRTPAIHALEPVIWTVFGLAAAPSVALWTRLAARLGVARTFALACLAEAGGVFASVAWPTKSGVFVAAIVVGGTFMGLTALGLARARALVVGDSRRALALMTGGFGLGQIIGPTFAGILSDRSGGFTTPSLAAVLALIAAAFLARK